MALYQLAQVAYLSDDPAPEQQDALSRVEQICTAEPDRLEFVQALVTHLLKACLVQRHAPAFWERVLSGEIACAVGELHALIMRRSSALAQLQTLCEKLSVPLLCVEAGYEDLASQQLHMLESVLFSQLAPGFAGAVRTFYSRAIAAQRQKSGSASGEDFNSSTDTTTASAACSGCDDGECRCTTLLEEAHRVSRQLRELRLLGPLAGGVVAELVCSQLTSRVEEVCRAGFTQRWIEQADGWCETLLEDWRRLLGDVPGLDELRQGAAASMCEMYARKRIEQLFDIIVDFPESQPALEELRLCLQRTPLRSELVTSLRQAVATRLLHPAANTEDILSAYVSAVRALRLLEPTGVLVDLVGEPIRQYLRGREDTVRCIVAALTEEGGGPLADELVRGEPTVLPPDGDMANWETWTPYPRDAPPAREAASPPADIISMLVNIYGSKLTFVKEYRKLLADRILRQTTYDLDRELKYLELLKRRFGDAELHECDVMLKDLFNSHRINWHIHSEERRHIKRQQSGDGPPAPASPQTPSAASPAAAADPAFPVHSLILSDQFWPDFREESLQLPTEYEHQLEEYTKEYSALKGNRTLCWKRHLGQVDLQIDLPGRTIELSVTPVHAVIIHHFQTKSYWTASKLSQTMQVPVSALRRKVAFWVSQGLLSEAENDGWRLTEGEGPTSGCEVPALLEDDTDSPMTSTEDQRERDLEVFWNYIVGMLTNLSSLPLERIQAMLRLFAMDGAEQCSTQELRAFLDRKVKQHKLLFSGGLYRLPKP